MASRDVKLLRFQAGHGWEGVERETYTRGPDGDRKWAGVTRQVLVGKQPCPTRFHVRYFEIEPRGYSSLERHEHSHFVIAVRGEGRAVVEAASYRLAPLDAIHIGPWAVHQFLNDGEEPFGFFCIVDSERDRPTTPPGSDLQAALSAGAKA